ncbi:oxidoreductase [Jatrophihabitans sp.]|uniref:oxidoreductase n=1 Tax=Jatrophihabitans sp. TaxID=1932789 RepID=UPI0030C70E7B|nr:Short-subunit dehydrogenase [Jatrophihabitans sp.]
MKWTAGQLPDLTGTVAVVTGGNSGIGWHTSHELAAHGARVVLACRDRARAGIAADRIRAKAPSAQVEVAELDLAAMDSVRSFAEGWTGPLDLLVNNAGVRAPPKPVRTVDGYELQFGTNHLGHYVLTGLLLPSLLKAPAGRVVTVSSIAHFGGTAAVVEGNVGESYNSQHTYSNSKLANLLFAFELHRELTARGLPVTSVAAHPGVSATGLVADPAGMGANPVLRYVAPVFLKVFTQSATAGARSTLYAATAAEPGSYTGPGRFGETRGPIGKAKRLPLADDEALARQLWTVSEELTGLHYPWTSSAVGGHP